MLYRWCVCFFVCFLSLLLFCFYLLCTFSHPALQTLDFFLQCSGFLPFLFFQWPDRLDERKIKKYKCKKIQKNSTFVTKRKKRFQSLQLVPLPVPPPPARADQVTRRDTPRWSSRPAFIEADPAWA